MLNFGNVVAHMATCTLQFLGGCHNISDSHSAANNANMAVSVYDTNHSCKFH